MGLAPAQSRHGQRGEIDETCLVLSLTLWQSLKVFLP
jgi:hypothetical protein